MGSTLRNERPRLAPSGVDRARAPRSTWQTRHANQRLIFEALAEGVVLYSVDADGSLAVEQANAAACTLLGLTPQEIRSMAIGADESGRLYDANGAPMAWQELPFAVTARTGHSVNVFVWGWRGPDGALRWISSNSRAILDPAGGTVAIVFSMVDITKRHGARRDLETAHDRFSALIEHSSDVICILDADAVVRYASPAYLAVYGEDPAERVGLPLSDRLHPDDRAKVRRVLTDLLANPAAVFTIECRILRAAGGIRHLEVTAANHLADPAIAGIVTNSRDVTERVETARRLAHEAMHDALTGLPNRALLLDRLAQALARARRSESRCALLFVDLDHFKHVNDSLGHLAGDQLLEVVATRLTRILRPGDTVARLGGDEFVILAEQIPTVIAATAIADRARVALSDPIDVAHRRISVGCSIGIALSDGSRPEALLQQADTALYKAKDRGRGRWEVYDQAMRVGAQARLDTEATLRSALTSNEIVVHYQPIVALPSGARVGAEALVRLQSAEGTLIAPDQFIPIAEDSGLIVPLGLEVLRVACAQQAQWAHRSSSLTRVSVNLSAKQLRTTGLVGEVSQTLSDAGLSGADLCLELTETALIDADESTRRAVHELTDLGIAIALDDFGTGMSSLAHLRKFPISVLKIDRSFVAGLGRNQGDTELVRAIVGLGRALGLRTVAEGVETRTQVHILTQLGCPEAQGFLFGRPVPAEQHAF